MKSILLAIAVMISFAANKSTWGNGVVVVEYNGVEINKEENPEWIVFPYEEWWK